MITVSTTDLIVGLIVAFSMGFMTKVLIERWIEFNEEYYNGK